MFLSFVFTKNNLDEGTKNPDFHPVGIFPRLCSGLGGKHIGDITTRCKAADTGGISESKRHVAVEMRHLLPNRVVLMLLHSDIMLLHFHCACQGVMICCIYENFGH